MCNSKGRTDGGEKADVHLKMAQALCNFILCEGTPRHEDTDNVLTCTHPIHDYLADIITDRMDEVIGYPIDKQMYAEDFGYYADKFFAVILDHIFDIQELIFKTIKDNNHENTI
jgi:hemerythrin-like domain-containing protein